MSGRIEGDANDDLSERLVLLLGRLERVNERFGQQENALSELNHSLVEVHASTGRKRWQLHPLRHAVQKGKLLPAVAAAVFVVVAIVFVSHLPSGARLPTAANAGWKVASVIDGATWSRGSAAQRTGQSADVTCSTPTRCFAYEAAAVGGAAVVKESTNGARSWASSLLPASDGLTSDIACPNPTTCFAAARSSDGQSVIATSDNDAATWRSGRTINTADITDLTCATANVCVGVGTSSLSGRAASITSSDHGQTWARGAMPPNFLPASPQGLSCSTPSVCVAVGITMSSTSPHHGAAVVTTDGGRHWRWASVPAFLVQIKAATCVRTACVAIGNGAPVDPTAPYGPSQALSSRDGGRHWVSYGEAGPQPAFLAAVSCQSASVCWASGALTKSPTGVIVSTTNGGQSWASDRLPTSTTVASRDGTGLSHPEVEGVSGINCPTTGSCVAIGSEGSTGVNLQIVLHTASTR